MSRAGEAWARRAEQALSTVSSAIGSALPPFGPEHTAAQMLAAWQQFSPASAMQHIEGTILAVEHWYSDEERAMYGAASPLRRGWLVASVHPQLNELFGALNELGSAMQGMLQHEVHADSPLAFIGAAISGMFDPTAGVRMALSANAEGREWQQRLGYVAEIAHRADDNLVNALRFAIVNQWNYMLSVFQEVAAKQGAPTLPRRRARAPKRSASASKPKASRSSSPRKSNDQGRKAVANPSKHKTKKSR